MKECEVGLGHHYLEIKSSPKRVLRFGVCGWSESDSVFLSVIVENVMGSDKINAKDIQNVLREKEIILKEEIWEIESIGASFFESWGTCLKIILKKRNI